ARLAVPPPLTGRHGAEPLAIPEAVAAPGGPPSDAGRRPRRGQCRLSRGVPRRLPLQSGVQKPLRRPTDARRATAAGRGAGSRWPMGLREALTSLALCCKNRMKTVLFSCYTQSRVYKPEDTR